MSDFCTRIELHAANGEDYNRLHEAMQRAGFSRVLNGHHLPTAEYWSTSLLTTAQVRDKARAIAETVKANPDVLVVKVADWAYYLSPVRKAG